jgi:hypothetical protein
MGTNLIFVLCCIAAVFAAMNREDIKAGNMSLALVSSD